MNAFPRRVGTVIERAGTSAAIEIREVIGARPGASEPVTTGVWTIRRPAPTTTDPEPPT